MTAIQTKFLFRLALDVGAHHVVGPTPFGSRRVAPIAGGTFDGPQLSGIVLPGGNLGNVSAFGKGLREMKEAGLIDRLPPHAGVPAVVHGDFKLDNVLLDPLDRDSWTVVGVLPAGFQHVGGAYRSTLQGDTVAIWRPLGLDVGEGCLRACHSTNAIVRLRVDGFMLQAVELSAIDGTILLTNAQVTGRNGTNPGGTGLSANDVTQVDIAGGTTVTGGVPPFNSGGLSGAGIIGAGTAITIDASTVRGGTGSDTVFGNSGAGGNGIELTNATGPPRSLPPSSSRATENRGNLPRLTPRLARFRQS